MKGEGKERRQNTMRRRRRRRRCRRHLRRLCQQKGIEKEEVLLERDGEKDGGWVERGVEVVQD